MPRLFAVIATVVLLLTGPPAAAQEATPARAPAHPPNFVVVLTDDMRADDLAHMPNVQRLLVAQGTTFAAFFRGLLHPDADLLPGAGESAARPVRP